MNFRPTILAFCFLLSACFFGSDVVTPVDPDTLPPMSGREQALMISAEAAQNQGNLDAAITDYQNAIGASSGHVEAHLALAKLYIAARQPDNARAVLTRGLALQPNHPGLNYTLGKLELASTNYTIAREAFERGLVTVPDDLDLSTADGVANDMLGDHEAAQTIYLRMLKLHKHDDLTAVHTNLGMSYLFTVEPKHAIAQLEPLAHKPGTPPVVRHNLALAYGLMNEPEKARAILKGDIDEETRIAELQRLRDYIGATDRNPRDTVKITTPAPVPPVFASPVENP